MSSSKNNQDRLDRIVAGARQHRKSLETTYRERALKLFPHVCGRCGREFSGRRLRELTVHHKDHNHENNPPDGSNWELLCLYCHDNEHARDAVAESYDGTASRETASSPGLGDKPFAGLEAMLKGHKDNNK